MKSRPPPSRTSASAAAMRSIAASSMRRMMSTDSSRKSRLKAIDDIVYSIVPRVRFINALIGLAAAARAISLAWLHPLNWDEIEYRRATAWAWNGLVPYRDFFEHHTPLQWFVFAPLTAIARGPGVSAIVALRFAQTIVWAIVFVLLSLWMRDAGISRFARLAAILIALCSSMFMLAAVEYRVDALGCALLVAAILLLQRGLLGWSGAALVLAGMANLRLGPVLVVALIAFAAVRRDRVLRLAGGVAGT